MATNESITTITTTTRPHPRSIPPIYLSYSNQNDFIERYFVVKLYDQLRANGLDEGIIWFDHHRGIHPDKSATWFADRLEAIDLSLGSLLILSTACQHQRLMTIESKAIVDRKLLSGTSSVYGLFVILLDECHDFAYLRSRADFFYAFNRTESMLTVEERISIILNELLGKLLPYTQFASMENHLTVNEQKTDEEGFKPICSWTSKDINAYLTRIGVHESSRDLFVEKQIDGYLLLACTENELKDYFLMSNHKIRQSLIEHVIRTIHHERQNPSQWHYESKKVKGKADQIYLIHDPEDHSIAKQISNFLKEKKFRVFTHNTRFGKSKHEFLALNGPIMARAKDVIYLLTRKSSRSTFTFHEITLAEWFEKPIVTIYIDNVWTNMRSSIRALLADYPSVDFIHQSLHESLGILHTYLRPQILTSDESPEFVRKLKQTVRPLVNIAAYNSNLQAKILPTVTDNNPNHARFVYLSYSKVNEKWNVVHAIERLVHVLETHHFHTGIQFINNTTTTARENDSYVSPNKIRSGCIRAEKSLKLQLLGEKFPYVVFDTNSSVRLPKLQSKSSSIITSDSYIHGFNPSLATSTEIRHAAGPGDIRHCRIMIVCLTPKYFLNEYCLNELRLCEIYQKPIVVCLLRRMNSYRSNLIVNNNMNLDEQINTFIPAQLPLTTLNLLRKNIRSSCVDLTTNELFSRNAPVLLRRLETIVGKYQNQIETSSNSLNGNNFSQRSEVF